MILKPFLYVLVVFSSGFLCLIQLIAYLHDVQPNLPSFPYNSLCLSKNEETDDHLKDTVDILTTKLTNEIDIFETKEERLLEDVRAWRWVQSCEGVILTFICLGLIVGEHSFWKDENLPEDNLKKMSEKMNIRTEQNRFSILMYCLSSAIYMTCQMFKSNTPDSLIFSYLTDASTGTGGIKFCTTVLKDEDISYLLQVGFVIEVVSVFLCSFIVWVFVLQTMKANSNEFKSAKANYVRDHYNIILANILACFLIISVCNYIFEIKIRRYELRNNVSYIPFIYAKESSLFLFFLMQQLGIYVFAHNCLSNDRSNSERTNVSQIVDSFWINIGSLVPILLPIISMPSFYKIYQIFSDVDDVRDILFCKVMYILGVLIFIVMYLKMIMIVFKKNGLKHDEYSFLKTFILKKHKTETKLDCQTRAQDLKIPLLV